MLEFDSYRSIELFLSRLGTFTASMITTRASREGLDALIQSFEQDLMGFDSALGSNPGVKQIYDEIGAIEEVFLLEEQGEWKALADKAEELNSKYRGGIFREIERYAAMLATVLDSTESKPEIERLENLQAAISVIDQLPEQRREKVLGFVIPIRDELQSKIRKDERAYALEAENTTQLKTGDYANAEASLVELQRLAKGKKEFLIDERWEIIESWKKAEGAWNSGSVNALKTAKRHLSKIFGREGEEEKARFPSEAARNLKDIVNYAHEAAKLLDAGNFVGAQKLLRQITPNLLQNKTKLPDYIVQTKQFVDSVLEIEENIRDGEKDEKLQAILKSYEKTELAKFLPNILDSEYVRALGQDSRNLATLKNALEGGKWQSAKTKAESLSEKYKSEYYKGELSYLEKISALRSYLKNGNLSEAEKHLETFVSQNKFTQTAENFIGALFDARRRISQMNFNSSIFDDALAQTDAEIFKILTGETVERNSAIAEIKGAGKNIETLLENEKQGKWQPAKKIADNLHATFYSGENGKTELAKTIDYLTILVGISYEENRESMLEAFKSYRQAQHIIESLTDDGRKAGIMETLETERKGLKAKLDELGETPPEIRPSDLKTGYVLILSGRYADAIAHFEQLGNEEAVRPYVNFAGFGVRLNALPGKLILARQKEAKAEEFDELAVSAGMAAELGEAGADENAERYLEFYKRFLNDATKLREEVQEAIGEVNAVLQVSWGLDGEELIKNHLRERLNNLTEH